MSNLPIFTSELSIYKSNNHYSSKAGMSNSGAAEVRLAATSKFGSAAFSAVNSGVLAPPGLSGWKYGVCFAGCMAGCIRLGGGFMCSSVCDSTCEAIPL